MKNFRQTAGLAALPQLIADANDAAARFLENKTGNMDADMDKSAETERRVRVFIPDYCSIR